MWKKTLKTNASPVSLILRLTLGAVMLPHGLQMAFGWFGGNGLAQTVTYFTQYQHIPLPLAVIGALTPLVASIFLLAGLFGRLMALLLGIFLAVAMTTVHLSTGFFMNWTGSLHGEGYEFHLLGIGMALALVVAGSGLYSLDRRLAR